MYVRNYILESTAQFTRGQNGIIGQDGQNYNQLNCLHEPQESPFVLKYTVSGHIVKQIWPRKYPLNGANPTITPVVGCLG